MVAGWVPVVSGTGDREVDVMRSTEVLVDGFVRIQQVVHQTATGLTAEELVHRVDDDANSIAWLLWHLSRVQDDHLAEAAGVDQVWTVGEWVDRFQLPFSPTATGFGHRSADVAAVRVSSPDLLLGYHDAVHEQTVAYVGELADSELDRIIDHSWEPAVSLGVRLVSVTADNLQHAGQAAFIRGILR